MAMFLTIALSGCLSDNGARNRPDPLTGLPKNPPTISSTYGSIDSSKSASLAASGTAMPASTSSLGIRDGQSSSTNAGNPDTNAWTGTESRNTPATGMPAKLGSPAAPTNSTASSSPLTTAGPAPVVKAKDFEDAQRILFAHGMNWQKLQMVDGKRWEFSCTIPNKANPNVMRNYEATDRFGLLAMQQVIDQIVRDQGR
jgi:hypothetical protein